MSRKDNFVVVKHASAIDQIKDEVKLILKGIRSNRITGGEAARSAAIGAVAAALAGGGAGAIIGSARKGKDGKRKTGKGALYGALIGAIAGGASGPAYAQLRKYLDGVPFDNSVFDSRHHAPGEKVYIGVAGSANGEGSSLFAHEMRKRFPGRAYMLRHVDGKKLKQKYDELVGNGLDVTVVGHSSGAATSSRFLHDNPDAKGYSIDPVSWLGRVKPGKNNVVFTADESTRHGGEFDNTIADVGGRWNVDGKNSVVFKGSHSNSLARIIMSYIRKGVTPDNPSGCIPSWVTSEFEKERE